MTDSVSPLLDQPTWWKGKLIHYKETTGVDLDEDIFLSVLVGMLENQRRHVLLNTSVEKAAVVAKIVENVGLACIPSVDH